MKCAVPATLLFALLATACARAPKPVAAVAADGMNWESMRQLPDFSGWWIWDYMATNEFPAGGGLGPMPLKPEFQAVAKQMNERFAAVVARAAAPDATAEEASRLQALMSPNYCRPPVFLGSNASEGSLEFLFTPGRVTILDETGLTRRVVLNQPLPDEVAESSAGTSVGHWEGQTLVVETTGFDAAARLGRKARSVERIWLKEPDVLQIDITLTAPDVLTEAYKDTWYFRRDADHQFAEFSTCKSRDRSIDPETLKNRFDATPPADLPPPPKD